jgi:hypothetical protein
MEFVHKAVVERGEILEALGTGFFQAFEKKHLGARIELFEEMAELRHRVAAGGNAENVVHQSLHELLSDILAGKIAFGKLPGRQQLAEWDRLFGERNRMRLMGGHAGDTPGLGWEYEC